MPSMTPRILQELLPDPPSSTTVCEQLEVSDLLAYIEAELTGQDEAQLSPQLQQVLENSLVCQQEYTELKELLLREYQGQWREPPHDAKIDFSYLLTTAMLDEVDEATFWSFDKTGRLFIFFPADRLHPTQPHKPQADYAHLRAEEGPLILFTDKVISGKDLDVGLTVRAEPGQTEECTIIINAHIPSRGGWPHLADTLVTLLCEQKSWQAQYTDEFGDALFERFPIKALDDLMVVVESGPSASSAVGQYSRAEVARQ